MKYFLILFAFLVSSCNIYTGVILDRVMPGTTKKYPISDTTACAIKINFIEEQKEIWCKDILCQDDYGKGDTIQFYFSNKRKTHILKP